MHVLVVVVLFVVCFAGCAGNGLQPSLSQEPAAGPPPSPRQEEELPPRPEALGRVEVDVANALGVSLPARVDFLDTLGHPPLSFEAPSGIVEAELPIGQYRAYIHVYDSGVPILSEIQDIDVTESNHTFLAVNILEGSYGELALHQFDQDGDLALDRVEIEAGTDPLDAASIPGRPKLPFDRTVLSNEARWYRGELHAHSHHGRGTESVAQLIRRAERAKLDFLAITDRNTMDSIYDPDFKSSSLVLIPAMEWGLDERGYALIYGPRTLPDPPSSLNAAQAECLRVQAQGGIFAIAHPTFQHAPWLWGLSHVNAVQVWNRDWRAVPPLNLRQLPEVPEYDIMERHRGGLVHSIAAAAAASDLDEMSANVQAARFWDYELVRGLKAAGIAGTNTTSPQSPMGAPVTYIYAEDKSLPSLLEGLRLGRTYMSASLDGPRINFSAKVQITGGADVGVGGVLPLNVTSRFVVGVLGAEGKKLQVLDNGRPILTKIIENNSYVHTFEQTPTNYAAYRVRVIGEPRKPNEPFGPVEVYAMTSPIYAQDITRQTLWSFPNLDPNSTWIRIEEDDTPELILPEHLPPMPIGQPWQQQRQPMDLSPDEWREFEVPAGGMR